MLVKPEQLMTESLKTVPWGDRVIRILAAAINEVDPRRAVEQHFRRRGDALEVNGRRYPLSSYKRILVVGAGKACAPMAEAVEAALGPELTAGLVLVKEGYAGRPGSQDGDSLHRIELIEAGHPIPDERGLAGTRRVVELLRGITDKDLVIVLISGGASALLTAPEPDLDLDDLRQLTSMLLRSGADIQEINALRKHLETMKGGRLAKLAAPATIITLILSDVVGDPLDVIASGPTAPDQSTYQDALDVLERYDIKDRVPPGVVRHLQKGRCGELQETPKEQDIIFQRVHQVVVGSNLQAASAALSAAHDEGFHTMLLTTYLQGEARQAGRLLAAIARQIDPSGQPLARPACLVSGGETTVTVTGRGKGGRNQEVALGAVMDLAGLNDMALVTLATDGGDGPTDAAGAVVTGDTYDRALKLGMNPREYLANNDSYHFFEQLGDLLRPGPTQTNVNDLTFVFAF